MWVNLLLNLPWRLELSGLASVIIIFFPFQFMVDGQAGHGGLHVRHHVVTQHEPVHVHVLTQRQNIKEKIAVVVFLKVKFAIRIHSVQVCQSNYHNNSYLII